MQKQLLITFDYELFLGTRSGSVDECMIFPARKIISILAKYGVHAVFFVDTTYLIRLREMSAESAVCLADFNKIAEQIRELIEQGHFVYPHIHPHWMDAHYDKEKNQWNLSNISKYRFHVLSIDEREKVFSESIHLLKSIIHPKFPNYQINAYRAGGWCIQPFNDFKPWFEKYQIKYDFSVLGGFYQFTDAQYFDFSNAPLKDIYRFENDVCEEIPQGQFIQFNISSIDINSSLVIFNKMWLKFQSKVLKDHTFHKGIGLNSKELTGIFPVSGAGLKLGNAFRERISIELMTFIKLIKYHNYLENHTYMHFLSHPKMITRHNEVVFNKFLEKVFDKYSIETDFHLMIP